MRGVHSARPRRHQHVGVSCVLTGADDRVGQGALDRRDQRVRDRPLIVDDDDPGATHAAIVPRHAAGTPFSSHLCRPGRHECDEREPRSARAMAAWISETTRRPPPDDVRVGVDERAKVAEDYLVPPAQVVLAGAVRGVAVPPVDLDDQPELEPDEVEAELPAAAPRELDPWLRQSGAPEQPQRLGLEVARRAVGADALGEQHFAQRRTAWPARARAAFEQRKDARRSDQPLRNGGVVCVLELPVAELIGRVEQGPGGCRDRQPTVARDVRRREVLPVDSQASDPAAVARWDGERRDAPARAARSTNPSPRSARRSTPARAPGARTKLDARSWVTSPRS